MKRDEINRHPAARPVTVRDQIKQAARDITAAAGWKVDPSEVFETSQHPRARDAWALAMVAWESFHGDTPDLDADLDEATPEDAPPADGAGEALGKAVDWAIDGDRWLTDDGITRIVVDFEGGLAPGEAERFGGGLHRALCDIGRAAIGISAGGGLGRVLTMRAPDVAPLLGETVEVPAVAYEAALELLRDVMDLELDFYGQCPGCDVELVDGAEVSHGDSCAIGGAALVRAALDYTDPTAQAAAVEQLRRAGGGA